MKSSPESGRFRILLRNFNRQFLDNELTSAEGNPVDTLVHLAALFGALSVCLSLVFLMKFWGAYGRMSWEQRVLISWDDREFLISLSMAVTSFITVLCWDALFPARRDCFILSSLPVRMRTVLAAKIASLAMLVALATVAANGFTSIVFPLMVLYERIAPLIALKYIAVHLLTISAAGLFAFLSLLAVQGVLINVLSYRAFLRVSAWVQLGILLPILSLFFMVPAIAQPGALAQPENFRVALWLPPFWFVGLYEYLLNGGPWFVTRLAGAAGAGLATAAVLAILAYVVGYPRHTRKAIEEENVVPRREGSLPDPMEWLGRLWRDPIEAGVFGFVSKTMLRDRRHRVVLALYCTVGLAYVCKAVVTLVNHGPGWMAEPNPEATSIPLLLSFFLLFGMRMLFTLPVELEANWIFRITENDRPDRYLAGVRKVMLVLGVFPLALAPLPAYALFWGWETAFRHVVLVLLIELLITEWLLKDFTKIPFTCSFLPGKANLKMTFAGYAVMFSAAAFIVKNLETWLLYQPFRSYLAPTVGLAGWLAWMVMRRNRRERSMQGFTYEERPDWVVTTLSLQQ